MKLEFKPEENRLFLGCVFDNLLHEVVEFINANHKPEDIFSQAQLENWAYRNGFEEKNAPKF